MWECVVEQWLGVRRMLSNKKVNVNLLEKQLSTVYFKDVRFPWVTVFYTVHKHLHAFRLTSRRTIGIRNTTNPERHKKHLTIKI